MSTPNPHPPDEYVIESRGPEFEGWFPLGEVSLLAASSGIGKTTWMIQLLDRMSHGQQVFSHNAKQREYRIILHDRSIGSFHRTLKRMHLGADIQQNVIRLTPEQQLAEPSAILAQIIAQNPTADILFIEGLDMWASDPNDMQVVSRLIDSLQRIAEEKHIAIIGSVGCPKQKPRDKYQLQRDAVFGSSAWGRKVETIVFLELSDPKNPNSARRCFVMPRNGKTEEYTLEFSKGQPAETVLSAPIPIETVSESPFSKYLDSVKPGTRLTWTEETGIKKPTFYRGLKEAGDRVFKHNGAYYKALESTDTVPPATTAPTVPKAPLLLEPTAIKAADTPVSTPPVEDAPEPTAMAAPSYSADEWKEWRGRVK